MADMSEIIRALNELAPPDLAEDWDNPGLQVGDPSGEVDRVLLTVDVTYPVAEEAIRKEAGLIVSHHPLIFHPLRRIHYATAQGKLLRLILSRGLTVFSAHTNLDSAQGGVNDALAGLLSLQNLTPLRPASETTGLGRIGEFSTPLSLDEAILKIKNGMGLTSLRAAGRIQKKIRRVALCAGSGGELVEAAVELGAELYVTGELGYHAALNAVSSGLTLLELGHWSSERIVLEQLKSYLNRRFHQLSVLLSENDADVPYFV